MKKVTLILVLLFIGCGWKNWSWIPPDSLNDVTIKIGDQVMIKRIGELFDIKVSIENAISVIGLNAWILYDPTIIEVVDNDVNTEDTQVITKDLGFFGTATLLASIQKDIDGVEQHGTLICGHVSIPPVPIDGNGDAFSVKFRAITSGSTNIEFAVDHLNLQDIDGDIPTNGVGDNVDVAVNATITITVL